MCPWRSSLARGTVEGRALALAQRADRRAAALARLAFASIDAELVLEVSGPAIGRREIAQRGSACCERPLERVANRVRDFLPAHGGNAARRTQGMDSCFVQ